MSETELRHALVLECKKVQENSLYSATAHFTSAGALRFVNLYVLGPIPIVLGAVGGSKLLTENSTNPRAVTFAAAFSLLAGIFGSFISLWNLSERQARHATAGTLFKSLEHDARRAHELQALDEALEVFKKRVVELGDRYNTLNENSIPTTDWGFKKARKKIQKGLFVTDVDQKDLL